jgi:hypothetical protein
MAKIKSIEMQCLHCKEWFRSPVQFGDTESFDSGVLFGNQAKCPKCKKVTACNKENFRMYAENGGFLGNETVL